MQHVQERRNRPSQILDLVISSDDDNLLRVCVCLPSCLIISLLTLMYRYTNKCVSAKVISYRKYKSIDKEALLADLRVSSLILDPPDDMNHLIDLYNSTLRNVVD